MDPKAITSFFKYVLGPAVAAVVSIAGARYAQESHNARGATGYATLADRVNTLEQAQEQQRADIALLSRACTAPPAQRGAKIAPLSVQRPVPLKRVPSLLEHLPAQ